MGAMEAFADNSLDPPVRGVLHRSGDPQAILVLTHGAGGNCRGPLLEALGEAFSGAGIAVLRCDLPSRQTRPYGPPRPGDAERDRQGLSNAVMAARKLAGTVFLGGHSYGGRQASMLAAENPEIAAGLLLLSYPLHPPGRPERLRTAHLSSLQVDALFVHGGRDPFGSIEEMAEAIKLIPAKAEIYAVESAGHDLGFKGKARNPVLPGAIVRKFQEFQR